MASIKDILGYKKQVETLKQVCDFLKNTDKYLQLGATIPKGMVIYGESGVGKSFMSEALMEDSERCPFYIDCCYCSVKEIEKQFSRARKIADSVILLDHADCLDKNGVEASALSYEVEQIANGEIFVIALAEKEENLADFMRGKVPFEIRLELTSPELEDAKLIYKAAFDGKNMDESFNYDDFCRFADSMTYPEIEQIVNRAMLLSIYEGANCITTDHVVKARVLLDDDSLADEYNEDTAYHEASHAAVHMLLGGKPNYILMFGDYGGGVFMEGDYDDDQTFERKERRYIVGVAGKASAEVFFGKRALGVKTDLKRMSEHLEHDMSHLGTEGFSLYDSTSELNSPSFNDKLAQGVQANMQKYYDKAKQLLEQNKPLVQAIADRLKGKHYLLSSELTAIYNDYVASKK